ncbi:MAG: dTDP-4-dehydrorhamnose 3,5-epimerase [Lysobacterales bacterium]
MKRIETSLPGVVILEPTVYGDARGWFFEAFQRERFAAAGLPVDFVQTNVSRSARGVLRGLHHQWPQPQGKLVSVLEGSVFDVAVDIRQGSATFGRWFGAELSVDNHRMMYIPPGFAHGFAVLSDYAVFSYQCTALYERSADRSIAWNDPDIAVAWPISDPLLSDKDRQARPLREQPAEALPTVQACAS